MISLLIFPVGILIAIFPQEILMLWTRDPGIGENTRLLLRLVIVGYLLNATVTMPYMLQLAYGSTSLAFYKNMVAIIILIPLLFLLIHYLGTAGGAVTWLILNAGYLLFEIPLMHRRLINHEIWHWYIVDVGLPVACYVIVGLILKIYFTNTVTTMMRLIALTTAFSSMFIACALALPFSRVYLRKVIL